MQKYLLLLVLLALCKAEPEKCEWNPNELELLEGNLTFVQSVTNGEKYIIGDVTPGGDYVYVSKLKGTSYEMGKAFGELFKEELKEQMNLFYGYVKESIKKKIEEQSLPPFIAKFLIDNSITGLDSLLDLDVMVTKRYTHPRYFQEIQGIADGAGFGYKALLRLNIFPEFIKAACTVAGIWGRASAFNHTLHMRALDWDYDNPISKFPLINVYHPSEKGAIKHINIGYVGFVGVLTGVSEKISIGEKVWIPKKNTVKTTRFGTPWTYALRDVLYSAHNMPQAIEILTKTPRTCTIHLGVASREDQQFRMFEYSQNILNNYDDKNYTHYTVNHTKSEGIAFFNKHVQPNNDPCMSKTITNSTMHGQWTAESFFRIVGNIHKTGDTQLVVFDHEAQEFYVSYSNTDSKGKSHKAYERRPILVSMEELWEQF